MVADLYLDFVVDPRDNPGIEVLFGEFGVDQFDPLFADQCPCGLQERVQSRMVAADRQLTVIEANKMTSLFDCVFDGSKKCFEGRKIS